MAEIEIDDHKLEQIFDQNPNMKAKLQHLAAENHRLSVKMMLEQQYECRSASLRVRREGNVVNIEWRLKHGEAKDYFVCGTIRGIDFMPDPSRVKHTPFMVNDGQQFVRLELEEGHAYFFEFIFLPEGQSDNNNAETDGARNSLDEVFFQVAIPLSDGRKLNQQPAKKLEIEMMKYLKVDDAYDSMCEIASEHIRSKKLPPEEEQNRIERFKARAGFLKAELGM
jgi:hypothetical protein